MKHLLVGFAIVSLLQIATCDCGCKRYFDPVCGTNDRDYPNICELHCDSVRKGDDQLTLAYGGPCMCDCSYCSTRYEPVCGSDSRTYWNSCWLHCYDACNQRRDQTRVARLYRGYCSYSNNIVSLGK